MTKYASWKGLVRGPHQSAVMAETMKAKNLSKTEIVARMQTSRSAVARLLDPNNTSISLQTMERAAQALGKRLEIQLV